VSPVGVSPEGWHKLVCKATVYGKEQETRDVSYACQGKWAWVYGLELMLSPAIERTLHIAGF
jgi:hypothetical protein